MFQIIILIFTPILGEINDPIWAYFFDGWFNHQLVIVERNPWRIHGDDCIFTYIYHNYVVLSDIVYFHPDPWGNQWSNLTCAYLFKWVGSTLKPTNNQIKARSSMLVKTEIKGWKLKNHLADIHFPFRMPARRRDSRSDSRRGGDLRRGGGTVAEVRGKVL